jgi:hypothetical protein
MPAFQLVSVHPANHHSTGFAKLVCNASSPNGKKKKARPLGRAFRF